MSQLQKVCTNIGRWNSIRPVNFVSFSNFKKKWLHVTSQPVEYDQSQLELDQARPMKEIPTISKFSMLLSFLPGGKFYNLTLAELLKKLYKEHGDLFLLPGFLGRNPILFAFNPEDFAKVHRTEGKYPNRRSFQSFKHHRSELRKDFFQGVEGLLTTQGEEWLKFRNVVNPVLMQPRIIQTYIPKMSKVNWEFIQRVKEIRDPVTLEVPDNFEEEINRFSLESVSIVALDKEIGLIRENRDNSEANKLFDDLGTFFRVMVALEIQPSFWKIFPTANYREMMSALDGINDFVYKYVQEAIDRLENSPTEKPEHEKGVLEKLLKIDKKIATVMALDMLMAGVDTTTTTLSAVLLNLSKNPDKQEKLRKELCKVLPQKDSEMTDSKLKQVPYLRACVKETLRVNPVTVAVARKTSKDIVLSGYRVPEGVDVSMINMFANKDPKYFVEADKFLPERWLRIDPADPTDLIQGSSTNHPFSYLPFGYGPRMCIGRRVVGLEMDLLIARFIRNFKVEFNYPTENAFKSGTIFTPAIPLKFKFTDVIN